MTALDATARAWLRAHKKQIPAELRPGRLEPAQRGHDGHTTAVELDVDCRLGGWDPLAWLLASEALANRIDRASRRDEMLLRDARAALGATRRAPGWTGRAAAERTAERRRAQERAAQAAGQLGLWGSAAP